MSSGFNFPLNLLYDSCEFLYIFLCFKGPIKITTSSSLLPWSQGMKLKQHVEAPKLFGKADRCMPLKQKIQLRSVPFSSDININGMLCTKTHV